MAFTSNAPGVNRGRTRNRRRMRVAHESRRRSAGGAGAGHAAVRPVSAVRVSGESRSSRHVLVIVSGQRCGTRGGTRGGTGPIGRRQERLEAAVDAVWTPVGNGHSRPGDARRQGCRPVPLRPCDHGVAGRCTAGDGGHSDHVARAAVRHGLPATGPISVAGTPSGRGCSFEPSCFEVVASKPADHAVRSTGMPNTRRINMMWETPEYTVVEVCAEATGYFYRG